jgi:hypothetical protein
MLSRLPHGPGDDAEWVEFSRAGGQIMQLTLSYPVWRTTSDEAMRERLVRVCDDEGPDNLDPSNILAELSVAAILHTCDAHVDLSVADACRADAFARFGPWWWVIECKRPRKVRGIRRNLSEAAGQLITRRKVLPADVRGLAVIAADLLVEEEFPPPMTANFGSLEDTIKRVAARVAGRLRAARNEIIATGADLYPQATMLAAFYTCAVRLEGGGTYVYHDLALVPPTTTSVPEADVLARCFETEIRIDTADFLWRLRPS